MTISDNALKILKKRYFAEGEKTWEDLCLRVAEIVASAEKESDEREKWSQIYKRIMQDLDFLPNSPTLFNLGRNEGCGSACFVLPVDDNRERIFKTLSDAVGVQTYGGGTGFNFSKLSPKGCSLPDQTGKAFGPVSFMKIYDYTIGNLTRQAGIRHGANMGILRIDHPDIEEFILSKREEGMLKNFNISVGITDAFMKAIRADENFDLIFDGRIFKTLRARDLWKLIIEGAWKNGEPGIVFLDTINRENPLRPLGWIEATNPCGEQPLHPYSSCNLGSINLSQIIKGDWIEQPAEIDWKKLGQTIEIAIRFLDSVIMVNRYPVAEIEHMSLKTRQIGLGIMGFADLCIKLHIRYGSQESIELAQKLMRFIYSRANAASVALGKEKGPAPVYDEFKLTTPRRRNATLTTIAPTGTLSIIADCSSGCEPHYAFTYTKQCLEGEILSMTPKVLLEWIAAKGGQPLPEYFVTSQDVSMEEHIRVQAAFQKNGVDSGVSKTINAPYHTTQEQVAEAFFLAWQLGCKGITFYRIGSRKKQVFYARD